jgi:MOSC domain-containing protein YiiM
MPEPPIFAPRLIQLRTGRVALQGSHRTAYAKASRTGSVRAHALGLEGDEVGNPRVHGGPEKAIYAYGAGAYASWIVEQPQHADRLVPGAFGENLLIAGLDEGSTCIGDRWRIGTALVEVCQPRQPCSTLARWFDDPRMVKAMVRNGLSGWYLRVLQEGEMTAGDALTLEHRPQGAWSIARVLEASYRSPPDRAELGDMAKAAGLASSWAAWAAGMAEADKPKAKPL